MSRARTAGDATLSGQPVGKPIKLAISAVNDAGESVRGEVGTITLA